MRSSITAILHANSIKNQALNLFLAWKGHGLGLGLKFLGILSVIFMVPYVNYKHKYANEAEQLGQFREAILAECKVGKL